MKQLYKNNEFEIQVGSGGGILTTKKFILSVSGKYVLLNNMPIAELIFKLDFLCFFKLVLGNKVKIGLLKHNGNTSDVFTQGIKYPKVFLNNEHLFCKKHILLPNKPIDEYLPYQLALLLLLNVSKYNAD